ncbi:MAG: hypothetical protein ACYC4J_13130, partial [Gemmatimonadaceae bacterium]
MIRELGYASIVVALVLSVVGTVLATMHAATRGSLSKTAQAMAYTIFGLLTVATACMVTGLV